MDCAIVISQRVCDLAAPRTSSWGPLSHPSHPTPAPHAHPGFLLREVLTDATSFEEARAGLAESPLIAPVYYTVAGLVAGESGIITREVEEYGAASLCMPACLRL